MHYSLYDLWYYVFFYWPGDVSLQLAIFPNKVCQLVDGMFVVTKSAASVIKWKFYVSDAEPYPILETNYYMCIYNEK